MTAGAEENRRSLDFGGPARPVVGMVHLRALPGAPEYGGNLEAVRTAAFRDAGALQAGGTDALLVENYFDAPFYPDCVPAHTVAHMTAIASALLQRFDLPLGVNVLRNDGCAALAIAQAAGGDFVRVNVLTGARLTDQGIVQGNAHLLSRDRQLLGARQVRIFADVNVKHSAPLAAYDPDQEVADALQRGGADAVVVSGSGTGKPIEAAELKRVCAAAAGAPVLVGSGVSAAKLSDLAGASGFIVGTSVKRAGEVSNPVDPRRVRRLIDAIAGLPSVPAR